MNLYSLGMKCGRYSSNRCKSKVPDFEDNSKMTVSDSFFFFTISRLMNSLSYLYYTLYDVATKLKNFFACILSIFYLYAHIYMYLASIEINA